jgi:hypothetical protein
METIPLSETSAAACARALVFSWITPLWGAETINPDHGPQLNFNVWSQLCEM